MMKVLKILKVLIILKRFSFKRRAVVLMLKNYGFTLTFRQFHGKLNRDQSCSEKKSNVSTQSTIGLDCYSGTKTCFGIHVDHVVHTGGGGCHC